MHKLSSKCFAISLALLSLPAISYSQNSYQVELTANLSKDKTNTNEVEATFLTANVFLDEVETGSHPYAEAAFLEQASSLSVGYSDYDFTSTAFDFSGNEIIFGINYIVPNSLLIFQGGYFTNDGEFKNGLSENFESDGAYIGIGKYISKTSAIIATYSQLDLETNLAPSTISTTKITKIGVGYKIVEKLKNGAAFNLAASLRSSDVDIDTTSETNSIIAFSGDYYHNQSISVGASIKINSGDDKGDEGKTFGLNSNIFLAPNFAVFVQFNQFNADNISGDDSDKVVLGGIARF